MVKMIPENFGIRGYLRGSLKYAGQNHMDCKILRTLWKSFYDITNQTNVAYK